MRVRAVTRNQQTRQPNDQCSALDKPECKSRNRVIFGACYIFNYYIKLAREWVLPKKVLEGGLQWIFWVTTTTTICEWLVFWFFFWILIEWLLSLFLGWPSSSCVLLLLVYLCEHISVFGREIQRVGEYSREVDRWCIEKLQVKWKKSVDCGYQGSCYK